MTRQTDTDTSQRTPFHFMLILVLATLTGGNMHSHASDYSADQQARIDLALEIVNSYRTLRSSCTDVDDEMKEMCYYRLKVGLWDYKEARKTLTDYGIRVHSAEQLAER